MIIGGRGGMREFPDALRIRCEIGRRCFAIEWMGKWRERRDPIGTERPAPQARGVPTGPSIDSQQRISWILQIRRAKCRSAGGHVDGEHVVGTESPVVLVVVL